MHADSTEMRVDCHTMGGPGPPPVPRFRQHASKPGAFVRTAFRRSFRICSSFLGTQGTHPPIRGRARSTRPCRIRRRAVALVSTWPSPSRDLSVDNVSGLDSSRCPLSDHFPPPHAQFAAVRGRRSPYAIHACTRLNVNAPCTQGSMRVAPAHPTWHQQLICAHQICAAKQHTSMMRPNHTMLTLT